MVLDNMDNNWLSNFSDGPAKIHGEFGIIDKILSTLNNTLNDNHQHFCVEFGAGNGIGASNSYNLIHSQNFSALLIEPDPIKFNHLQDLYTNNQHVITHNGYVSWQGDDSLDNILSKYNAPKCFDLLSIDIDGNDYHVWESLINYEPYLVVIEFNETIPVTVSFIQEKNPSINQGSSLLALFDLAKLKGYELICVSENNAFFIHKRFFHLFNIHDNSPLSMVPHQKYITYIFTGYDGTTHLAGNPTMRWHFSDFKSSKIQQLPFFLRSFPPNYNFIQRLLFRIWRRLR